jgi:predicted nucleic acid-binding Zn ribbon protein
MTKHGLQKKARRLKYKNEGRCRDCGSLLDVVTNKNFCSKCWVAWKGSAKRYRDSMKEKAYAILGGYKCRCCGETEKVFLAVDHINNDGPVDRKQCGGGTGLHRLVIMRNGVGFQILCFNCNWAKSHGGCPHTKIH